MQLPTVDRTPNLRPSGADAASSGANKVIPVAPVNPSVSAHATLQPVASVVNLVNPALKANEGEPVYTSVVDPTQHSAAPASTSTTDWTTSRPTPVKVEDPPPKPIYQVLMDQIKSMWTASASAIQLEQVNGQQDSHATVAPTQAPGTLAHQALVYDHNTIKKNERIS